MADPEAVGGGGQDVGAWAETTTGMTGGSATGSPTDTGPSSVPPGQPGGGGSSAAESEYIGIRDALASYGIDLRGQFSDDHAALQHLALAYQQNQQSQRLAQYGQQYLQNYDAFQAFQRQQQQAADYARQQQQQWWQAPPYDPRWAGQIVKDPNTGQYQPVPGADPSVVQKYLAWQEHQRGFIDRFSQNPIEAIKPGLEQLARQVAMEVVNQNLGGYRSQEAARGLVERNSGWLHAHDANGVVLRDRATGAPQLSEWGQRFHDYVTKAQQMGVGDVQGQWDFALASVQRDFMLSEREKGETPNAVGVGGGAPAANPNEAAKQQFLAAAAAARAPNASGSTTGGSAAQQNGSLSLREMMRRNLEAGGYGPGSEIPQPRR